jgi:hypothetical protein
MVFSYLGGRVDVAVGNNRDVGVGSLRHRLKRQYFIKKIPLQAGKAIILKHLTGKSTESTEDTGKLPKIFQVESAW